MRIAPSPPPPGGEGRVRGGEWMVHPFFGKGAISGLLDKIRSTKHKIRNKFKMESHQRWREAGEGVFGAENVIASALR